MPDGAGSNQSVAGPQSSGVADFLGMSSTYGAQPAPGGLYQWHGPGAGQEEGNQAAALQQQAAQLNMGAGAGYLGQSGMGAQQGGQSALEQNLYNTMMGNGMSAADLQLQQGQQNTLAAQLAAAHSAAGGAGQGTGAYNANQAGAQAGAQVNEAAGIQRAQESQAAAGLLGQTLQQQQAANLQAAAQQQQMAMSQAGLQEQQNQINAQTGLGYSAQALQAAEAQGQLGIAQGQQYLGAEQLNAQQSMANAQAMGGVGGGLMSAGAMLGAAAFLSDERAKTGVKYMADADFVEPGNEDKNHITLREEPFGLLMINRRTGEIGKITPQPMTDEEKRIAFGHHGAGGLNDPNRIRTVMHDGDMTTPPQQPPQQQQGGGITSNGPQGFGAGLDQGGTDSFGNPTQGYTGYYGNPSNGYYGSAYNANGGGYGPGQAGSAYGGATTNQDTTGFSNAYNPANGPSQWNGGWSPAQGAFNPMNNQQPIMHQAFYTPGKYSVSAPPIVQMPGQDANGNWLPGQGPSSSQDSSSQPQQVSRMATAMSAQSPSQGGNIQQLPVNPAAQANFPAAATGRAAGVARPGPLVSPTAQQVTSDPSTKMDVVSAGGNSPELNQLSAMANSSPMAGGAGLSLPSSQGGVPNAAQGLQQAQSMKNMANQGAGPAATSPQTQTDGGMTTPSVSPTPESSAGAGDLAGAAGDAAVADMDLVGGKRFKRPGGRTVSDEFLDQLSKSEATYSYKDPRNEPTTKPTGGRYLGVMAQAVKQSPEVGDQIVKSGPKGMYLEMGPSISAALAGLGRLNERLDAVESALGAGEENVKSTRAAKKGRK